MKPFLMQRCDKLKVQQFLSNAKRVELKSPKIDDERLIAGETNYKDNTNVDDKILLEQAMEQISGQNWYFFKKINGQHKPFNIFTIKKSVGGWALWVGFDY